MLTKSKHENRIYETQNGQHIIKCTEFVDKTVKPFGILLVNMCHSSRRNIGDLATI